MSRRSLFVLACTPLAIAAQPPAPVGPSPTVLAWAEILQARPSVRDVPDAKLRARIVATGLPWRVRDRQAGLELVLVPPGDYEQGAHAADRRASAVEKPQHVVRIEKPFWVARFEVTNAQFRRFKPAPRLTPQPWWKKKRRSAPVAPQPPIDRVVLDGADQPAVFVSWNEAAAYCKEFGFRLPTEGEWEYFARAGMSSAYFWGEDATQGRGFANVLDVVTGKALELEKATFAFDDGNRGTAKVGTFRANGFGLFDVTGNAWEWCADWYDPKAYAKAPPDQRARMFRVCRGGSWFDGPARCRLSSRNGFGPEDQVNLVGFRVVRDASKSPPSKSGPATEGKR